MNRNYFILFANEKYGNTDWVNHINNINLNSNYHTIFIGKGTRLGKKYYARNEILSSNSLLLMFKFLHFLFKIRGNNCIIVIRFFKSNILYNLLGRLILGKNFKFYLDIRSLYVGSNKLNYFVTHKLMRISSFFYYNTFLINNLIISKLKIKNAILLPLGMDLRQYKVYKSNDYFRFVYIGTLNRDGLYEFFSLFCKTVLNNDLKFDLTIYSENDSSEYVDLFEKYPSLIKFSGNLNRENLAHEISNYDIGISPLPFNKTYDLQPHTKLFEYIESGLPYISKSTIGVFDQFNNDELGWYYKCDFDIEEILINQISIDSYNVKLDLIKKKSFNTWAQLYITKIEPILV